MSLKRTIQRATGDIITSFELEYAPYEYTIIAVNSYAYFNNIVKLIKGE